MTLRPSAPCLAPLLLAMLSAHLAAAEPFTTSQGATVERTAPASLDCPGLARKLAEIDATGYRGARPTPADRRDRPLFDYETMVSIRYYSTCAELKAGAMPSVNVFRGGFNKPRARE